MTIITFFFIVSAFRDRQAVVVMSTVNEPERTPGMHVTVGYPVQDLQMLQAPPPMIYSGEVSVRYMKTFIVVVFVVSCIQAPLQLLCAMYLQQLVEHFKATV